MRDLTLTRQDNRQSLILPADMRWMDEFDWVKVAQTSPEYTLSGSLLVQYGVKLAGRPITLGGDWAWVPRSVVRTLHDWAGVPALRLDLSLPDGRDFVVAFALAGIKAQPVRFAAPLADEDAYTLEISLMTMV